MRDFTSSRRGGSPGCRSTWCAALAALACTSSLQIAHAQPAAPPAGPGGTAKPIGTSPPVSPAPAEPHGSAAPVAGAAAPAAASAGIPPEPAGPPPEPAPTAALPPEPAPTAAPPPEPVVVPPPVVLGEESPAADQAPDEPRGPFSRGSVRLTLLLGTGSSATDQYFILGGGVGYYLLDGLELGFDYEAWLFGDPVMQRVSPELRYVFHMVPVIKPYVGTFYRHTFVTDYDDLDYIGGRLGVFYIPKQSKIYLGGGAVYERLLDCTSNALVDCDTVYPEIAIGISL